MGSGRRIKRVRSKKLSPAFTSERVEIYEGDMRDVLARMEPETFTACVTDPPYELGFMSKQWDKTGIAFDPDTWRAVLRVLKPGAFALIFGGTRTFHRMACAVEDAGFEVRDTLMFMYGSGFPKGHDVSKGIDKLKGAKREKVRHTNPRNPKSIKSGQDIDGGDRPYLKKAREVGYHDMDSNDPATPEAALWSGWNVSLKPAWEPIIVAMKPLDGTFARNALKHGVAGLNVDGGRVGTSDKLQKLKGSFSFRGSGGADRAGKIIEYKEPGEGRWPANVILSHSPDCVCVGTRRVPTGTAYANTNGESTKSYSGGLRNRQRANEGYAGVDNREQVDLYACVPGCPVRMLDEQAGDCPTGKLEPHHKLRASANIAMSGPNQERNPRQSFGGDSGGASRFFYTAKASTSERHLGCPPGFKNLHPTVKPLGLCEYLCRLVTMPENTRILDPFCGSGSIPVAGYLEGVSVVGIDSDPESVRCTTERLRAAIKYGGRLHKLKRFRLKRRKGLRKARKR